MWASNLADLMVIDVFEVNNDAKWSYKRFPITRGCIDRGGKDSCLIQSLVQLVVTVKNGLLFHYGDPSPSGLTLKSSDDGKYS